MFLKKKNVLTFPLSPRAKQQETEGGTIQTLSPYYLLPITYYLGLDILKGRNVKDAEEIQLPRLRECMPTTVAKLFNMFSFYMPKKTVFTS